MNADEPTDGVRLSDVAERAGVSVTTASQSFSGRRPVAAATRERVWAAALELGFVPTAVRPTVAVLVRPPEALRSSTFGTTSFADLAGSIALAALNRGFSVFTAREVGDLVGGVARMDGCVLICPNSDDASLRALMKSVTPVVSYDPDPGAADFTWWVGADYYHSIGALLTHLRGRGSRRLALLLGQTDNMYRRAIIAASRAFGAELGAAPRIEVIDNARGQDAAREATARLWRAGSPPDAIITSSSIFATGVLRAAEELGVNVPGELRIATATDGPLAEFAATPITALRIDTHKSAQQVVELLDARINGGPEPTAGRQVQLELMIRRSTW